MKAFKVNRKQQDYYRVDLPPRLFLDGKRRSVMAKTRREALGKAEALITERKKGLNTDRSKATVAEFLTRFLDYYQTEGGVALRTWQDYRYHIETNIVPAIGTLPLGDLKPLQVDEWLRGLRERGLGDRTIDYATPSCAAPFSSPSNGRALIATPPARDSAPQSASAP